MYEEQESTPKLSSSKVYLRAGLVFVFLTVILIVVFIFAIKLFPKKETVLNISRGGLVDVELPIINEDEKMVVEICGDSDSTCLTLAENVFRDEKDIFIPADYPTGNATMRVFVAKADLESIPSTAVVEKKLTIVATDISDGDGKSVDNSDSIDSAIILFESDSSMPTFAPLSRPTTVATPISPGTSSPSGTIIRATPTPTPFLYNRDQPVLINH